MGNEFVSNVHSPDAEIGKKHCAEMRDWLESEFFVVEGRPASTTESGAVYVAICTGGIKEECGLIPAVASSPEVAVRLWREAVVDYIEQCNGGMLVVRAWPELFVIKESIERYCVYSRMVVDDGSAVKELHEIAAEHADQMAAEIGGTRVTYGKSEYF